MSKSLQSLADWLRVMAQSAPNQSDAQDIQQWADDVEGAVAALKGLLDAFDERQGAWPFPHPARDAARAALAS